MSNLIDQAVILMYTCYGSYYHLYIYNVWYIICVHTGGNKCENLREIRAIMRKFRPVFAKPPNYTGLPLTAAQNRNHARNLIAVYVRYFARDLANSRCRFAFYSAGKAREVTGNMRELAVIRENPRNFA